MILFLLLNCAARLPIGGAGSFYPVGGHSEAAMKRSGPEHAGPGRIFAVRVTLLLTVSFLIAGSGVAALMSLGYHPLTWAR